MLLGPHLCSSKRACQTNFEVALQSDRRTLWGKENCGCTKKVLLLAKTSTGGQKVYQVLHYLRYCQTDH